MRAVQSEGVDVDAWPSGGVNKSGEANLQKLNGDGGIRNPLSVSYTHTRIGRGRGGRDLALLGRILVVFSIQAFCGVHMLEIRVHRVFIMSPYESDDLPVMLWCECCLGFKRLFQNPRPIKLILRFHLFATCHSHRHAHVNVVLYCARVCARVCVCFVFAHVANVATPFTCRLAAQQHTTSRVASTGGLLCLTQTTPKITALRAHLAGSPSKLASARRADLTSSRRRVAPAHSGYAPLARGPCTPGLGPACTGPLLQRPEAASATLAGRARVSRPRARAPGIVHTANAAHAARSSSMLHQKRPQLPAACAPGTRQLTCHPSSSPPSLPSAPLPCVCSSVENRIVKIERSISYLKNQKKNFFTTHGHGT